MSSLRPFAPRVPDVPFVSEKILSREIIFPRFWISDVTLYCLMTKVKFTRTLASDSLLFRKNSRKEIRDTRDFGDTRDLGILSKKNLLC